MSVKVTQEVELAELSKEELIEQVEKMDKARRAASKAFLIIYVCAIAYLLKDHLATILSRLGAEVING